MPPRTRTPLEGRELRAPKESKNPIIKECSKCVRFDGYGFQRVCTVVLSVKGPRWTRYAEEVDGDVNRALNRDPGRGPDG